MFKKLYMKIISILLLFFITGCMYAVRYDGTYKGRIIDEDTGGPIEGVVVLGTWYVRNMNIDGGILKFYDARETVTDKNGEFEISGQGLRIMSSLEPMYVLIFKSGYNYIGSGPWESLKEGYGSDKIKWEGSRAIIPLRELTTIKEMRDSIPYSPPTEAPLKKVILMLKEINKVRVKLGAGPIDIWGGEKL